MDITTKRVRTSLIAGSIVFILIALVIAALVIPPVLADTFSQATPERAAKGLGVWAGLNLLLGIIVLASARPLSDANKSTPGLFGAMGGVAVVVDLVLLDAASAFEAHGPAMASTTTLLYICSVAGMLTGILLIISAILLKKRKSQVAVLQ